MPLGSDRRVEVLGECVPVPLDAGGQRGRLDVLGPLKVADHQTARIGPDRSQREPAVPHHHGGDAVPAGVGAVASQNTCASMWVCPSMNPGVTTWPSASISVEPRSGTRADLRDHPTGDTDVGPKGPFARPVHHRPTPDHDVMGHAAPLSELGTNEPILVAMSSSSEVRSRLNHPVIDSDGHMAEHLPRLAPYLEREGFPSTTLRCDDSFHHTAEPIEAGTSRRRRQPHRHPDSAVAMVERAGGSLD